MTTRHAIVLAAGRGSRLTPAFPQYLKPLIPINGRPLISWSVSLASLLGLQTRVVVAPENAALICQTLGPDFDYIIQPEARGVVDAIKRASPQEPFMLLMSDNYMNVGDTVTAWQGVLDVPFAVSLTRAPAMQRSQFTQFTQSRGFWRSDDVSDPDAKIWLGPAVVSPDMLTSATGPSPEDMLNAGHLDYGTTHVDSYAIDVGRIDVLNEMTRRDEE